MSLEGRFDVRRICAGVEEVGVIFIFYLICIRMRTLCCRAITMFRSCTMLLLGCSVE